METDLYKHLFRLPESEIDQAVEEWTNLLTKKGIPQSLVTPFQTYHPLIVERAAITAWIATQPAENQLQLRKALPEIMNASEALPMVKMDDPTLNQAQLNLLRKMLI